MSRISHTTTQDKAQLTSKLERMKAKFNEAKPIAQPRKKSEIRRLGQKLGKFRAPARRPAKNPNLYAAPVNCPTTSSYPSVPELRSTEIHPASFGPPPDEDRPYEQSVPTAATIAEPPTSPSSASSTTIDPDHQSTKTKLKKKRRRVPATYSGPPPDEDRASTPHEQSVPTAATIIEPPTSPSSASSTTTDPDHPSTKTKKKRCRVTYELPLVHWVIKQDAPNRRELDPLCPCRFITAHAHMVKCTTGVRCLETTGTNWFHSTCIGISDKGLMRLVERGSEYVCGQCRQLNEMGRPSCH